MKRMRFVSALCLLAVMLAGCVDQHPERQTGNTAEETRIVATSVAACEILEQLGIESEKVVGVPSTTAYTVPEIYQSAEEVGSPMAPDMEIVSSLNPTIILSPNSLQGDLETQYDNAGLNSAFLNLKSTVGMYKSIQELGELFGKEERAQELTDEFLAYMEEYESADREGKAPRVLILMGLPGSYVVATESSYAGSLVKLAGGINIYGDGDGTDFLNVNAEDMLQRDPDIILRTSHAMPEQVMAMFRDEFADNDIWQHFRAVQEGKVYDLDNNKFGMSANFRYKEALEELKPMLYGG